MGMEIIVKMTKKEKSRQRKMQEKMLANMQTIHGKYRKKMGYNVHTCERKIDLVGWNLEPLLHKNP